MSRSLTRSKNQKKPNQIQKTAEAPLRPRNPISIRAAGRFKFSRFEDTGEFSEATVDLFLFLFSLLAPRELMLPSAWQERYRIAPAHSPRSGRWRNYWYQIMPMDAIVAPECTGMVLLWASQFLGKTSVIEGVLLWMIDQKPTTVVMIHPNKENAEAWSKNRFGPAIELCSRVAKLVDRTETRKGTRSGYGQNTITHKRYPGGWFLAGGSNSGANLRAHTAELTIFDEEDAYVESAGKDGDIVILVQQRSARYPNAFSIETSTPLLKHFSRIEKAYEQTNMMKPVCTCPHCNQDWIIMFNDIKWNKIKDKEGKTVHDVENAWLECPNCLWKLTDEDRMKMSEETGRWVATNPSEKHKWGFWANAFIVMGRCQKGYKNWLHYFAKRWIDAYKLGANGIKTFQNLVCGESYESEQTKAPDVEVLFNRREKYPEFEGDIVLPEGCLFLVCGADVQLDRIEAEIFGYGYNEETWGVQYKVFRGNVDTPALWNQFDQWIQKKWRHSLGHMLAPAYVCIDSGNKPHPVYTFSHRCSPRPVYAVKGDRGYVANWISRSGTRSRLFILKIDGAKEALYSRLRLVEYGSGFQHFPENDGCGYDHVYFEQLCSETMRSSFVNGRVVPYFDKATSGARNESLDARIYGMACKDILNPDYDTIKEGLWEVPLNDWRPHKMEAKKIQELKERAEKEAERLVEVPVNNIDQRIRRGGSGWMRIT